MKHPLVVIAIYCVLALLSARLLFTGLRKGVFNVRGHSFVRAESPTGFWLVAAVTTLTIISFVAFVAFVGTKSRAAL